MHSGVVCKIRAYNPNKNGTKFANSEYLEYIATRPGVDISELSNTNLDMLNDENFVNYIAERPRSHGLFGNIDTSSLSNVKSEIRQIANDGKIIYRAIISLKEEDAHELGYLDKNKWKMLIDATIADIGNTFGISIANLKWTGAFHKESGHPHVHIMFWDSSNRVVSPFIHISKQNKCREIISKEIFRDEREVHIIEKSANRDSILSSGKKIVQDSVDSISNLFTDESFKQFIPNGIYPSEIDSISLKLLNLASSIPDHGRIAYAYMPSDIKEQINSITFEIFKRKDISNLISKYISNSTLLNKDLSLGKVKSVHSTEKAFNDITKRVGNIVLKAALNLHYNENISDEQIAAILNTPTTTEQIQNKNFLSYNDFIDIELSENNRETTDEIADYSLSSFSSDIPNSHSKINFWTSNFKLANSILYPIDKNVTPNYDKALKLLQIEAKNNNALALYELGKIYKLGLGVDINIDRSNDYYSKSLSAFNYAEKISPSDYYKYRIGKMHLYGIGTTQNAKEAFSWLSKSAKNNYQFAQYCLAGMYKDGIGVEQNFKEAFSLYSKSLLGKFNMPYSHYELGNLNLKGLGTECNVNSSYSHYEKALNSFIEINKTNPDDMMEYKIGSMYYKGLGCKKDLSKAIEYFYNSSLSKNCYAEYMLGKIFMDKSSEYYDLDKAFYYLSLSSNGGNQTAAFALSQIYLDENSKYFDLSKGISLLTMSSDHGNHFAQYTLGKLFLDKSSPVYNLPKAIYYLENASDQGNEFAQYTLGKIYCDKESEYYSIEKSIKYFNYAVLQGSDMSRYSLAKLYLDKNTSFYDPKTALDLLNKAATNNNSFAQLELAKIYYFGIHAKKDMELSNHWLNKSLQNNNSLANDFINYKNNLTWSHVYSIAYNLISSAFNETKREEQKSTYTFNQRKRSKKHQKKNINSHYNNFLE